MIERDVAEDIFIAEWSNWLRWAIMIPAAIIGSLIVPALFKIFANLSSTTDDSQLFRIISDVAQSVMFGIIFVIFAAYSAPRHQLTVAIIFSTISCILAGMLITFGLVYYPTGGEKMYLVFHALLVIAGSVGALIAVKQELEK